MIFLTNWLKITKYIGFSQTHLYIWIILVKNCVFFLQNVIIPEDNVLEYTEKIYAAKGGGLKNADRADKGGRVGLGNAETG